MKMRLIIGKIFAALLCVVTLLSCSAERQEAKDNNQRLWYDRPAQHWLEALPLGNSRMGAMIYGGVCEEEIQLNEETFWSGGPHNNNSTTSLKYLDEVRRLIFAGKEVEAEQIVNREFFTGPHGMKYLTLGSLKIISDSVGQPLNFMRDLNLKFNKRQKISSLSLLKLVDTTLSEMVTLNQTTIDTGG